MGTLRGNRVTQGVQGDNQGDIQRVQGTLEGKGDTRGDMQGVKGDTQGVQGDTQRVQGMLKGCRRHSEGVGDTQRDT